MTAFDCTDRSREWSEDLGGVGPHGIRAKSSQARRSGRDPSHVG